MRCRTTTLASLLWLASTIRADPTWPAATDEVEEILYQLTGFQARKFADNVMPCSKEAHGAGRITASEWLRTAFHDMATANTFFGTGGLDASLMYELGSTENLGPAFNTSMTTYADYFSPRSSMSDLIALGAAVSVRACGGPVIPIKAGRIDATAGGSTGVPQPQNDKGTFINQFSRMGFSQTEMIGLVACGHTLGAVHTAEFPDIVPSGTAPNNAATFDSSAAAFDNTIVNQYLNGTTTDPLDVGPSVTVKKNSDFVVFNSDKNVTMQGLADPAKFTTTCASLLQRMIEVVPSGVVLSAVVAPYAIKPVGMQLTLNTDGTTLALSGYIRAMTNAQAVQSITLNYKTRSGATGSSITATSTGNGAGADNTFSFFPIAATIPVSTGISSFTVTAALADGSTKTYDNNGVSYPISDAIYIQKPQSCLLQGPGSLTVTAMVRNDRAAQAASMFINYQVPQAGIPGPLLQNATVQLTKGKCVGGYTSFSGSYTISGGNSAVARIDVISGTGTDVVSDSFHAASELGGTCVAYAGTVACGNAVGTTTTSTIPSSSTTTTSKSSTSTSASTIISPSTSATSSSSSSSSSSVTVPTATPTLAHKSKIGAYSLVSCWTEGVNVRALTGATFAYDSMTLESCAANCSTGSWTYFGAEYGRECYCGNTLAASSSAAPLADCGMVCGGNSFEYCGAGNRLELYSLGGALTSSSVTLSSISTSTSTGTSSSSSSTAISSTTSTTSAMSKASISSSASSSASSPAAPSATLAHKAKVGKYSLKGCQTEGVNVRTLSASSYADDKMTLESCAAFCDAYKYFGTEYGRECWCGSYVDPSSAVAPLTDCSFTCAGSNLEYCGAGNRLELYST